MSRRNLLFIYTDERCFDTLAWNGNRDIFTPNLDQLARRSTAFERAYVRQEVCTPSRSSLLTGLHPHTTGRTETNVPLPPEVACLPQMLPRGVWTCAHI